MWIVIGVVIVIALILLIRHIANNHADKKRLQEENKWKTYFNNEKTDRKSSPSVTHTTTLPYKKSESKPSTCGGYHSSNRSNDPSVIPWVLPMCSSSDDSDDSGHDSCSSHSCSSHSDSSSSCSSSCGSGCGGGGD